MEKDLLNITEQLLQALEEGRERFLTGEKPDSDREFFNMMRKEADPVFRLLDEWTVQLSDLSHRKETDLHQQQIDATKENMESLILHSYYKDTRKRKFIEIYKSCYYIFTQFKKELV